MASEINSNGCNTELPSANQICTLSRKERYELFREKVTELRERLHTPNTEASVKEAIRDLENFMRCSSRNRDLSDISSFIFDVIGTIEGVKLHDVTRSSLDDLLSKVLEAVNAIIEKESRNEKARKLRELLTDIAQHAEELADILDIDKYLD